MLKSRFRYKKKFSYKKLLVRLGIVIIAILLIYKLAIPTIIQFSLLLENNKTSANNNIKEDLTIASPPVLIEDFSATNSATIDVTGYTQDKQTIVLFVNDNEMDEVNTKDNGEFKFSKVPLDNGDNTIYAVVKANNKFSKKSNTLSIIFNNSKPKISLDGISDGMTVSGSEIVLKGKSENTSSLTINNSWVPTRPDSSFEKSFFLDPGENSFTIVAQSTGGNTSSMNVKINRQD